MLWSRKKRASHRRHDDVLLTQHPRPRPRLLARLAREFDDWRQVSFLRVVVPVILAVVSFYYLTRWAHDNAMPWALAWTLPAALDVTAYKAVKVAQHATSTAARWKASALAWLCVVLSVAGNIGSHALDLGILRPSFMTIAFTAAVYPLMLAAGHIVAGGMSARPRTEAQIEHERAETAAARAERLRAEAEIRAARQAAKTTPAAPKTETAAPHTAPAPEEAPATPARGSREVDTRTDAELVEEAIEFLRHTPGGRRVLVGRDGIGISDHKAKTIHAAAMAHLEAEKQLTDGVRATSAA
jgi:hypothetical protein